MYIKNSNLILELTVWFDSFTETAQSIVTASDGSILYLRPTDTIEEAKMQFKEFAFQHRASRTKIIVT